MGLDVCYIVPQPAHKFLGVMLDQEFQWNQQANSTLAKSTKWTLAFQWLAKSFSGVNLQLMQQLFHVVTIPKILYAMGVWLTLVHQKLHACKSSSSVGATNRFTSLQQTAALAITGALHLTTTDILNLHTGLLPMAMVLWQVCFQAALWLATLPEPHPLHPLFHTQA